MTWMHKIATVTFSLEGSHKISQPKDLISLSTELVGLVHDSGYEGIRFDDIQPDGLQTSEYTGTINWYVKPEVVPEEDQKQLMEKWKRQQEMMGYKINIRGPERSGMNDWNSEPGQPVLMVYRLDVLENGSLDYMQIPEMNIANDNARALLGLLNLPAEELMGSIDLKDLRQRLATTTSARMQEFTQDPTGTPPTETPATEFGEDPLKDFIAFLRGEYEDPSRARSYDFGRSREQLDRYIGTLAQMVDFGLQNGFTKIQWA